MISPGTVTQGRAEDLVLLLTPGSVQAVITDIPYGTADSGKVIKRGGSFVAHDLSWDHVAPLEWIAGAVTALQPGGSFATFCDRADVTRVKEACEAEGLRLLNTAYWIKPNAPPTPRSNFTSAVEAAVICWKPTAPRLWWGGGGATPNYIEAPICAGAERSAHPTQKPLVVMQWLVRMLAVPGGLVLDPFCGSGTTLEAAYNEERVAVGFDLDPAWVDYSRARIKHRRQVLPGMALPEPAERYAQGELWTI